MEYVKYINENTIKNAPNIIFDEKIYIANPTKDILIEHGYKPLIKTELPQTSENEYVVPFYSEKEDRIVLSWIVKEYEEEVENGE